MQYITIYVSKGMLDVNDLIYILEKNTTVKTIKNVNSSFLVLESTETSFINLSEIIKIYAIDNYLDLKVWISRQRFSLEYGLDLIQEIKIFETAIYDNNTLFLELIRQKKVDKLSFIKTILLENNLFETAKKYIENNMNMRLASEELYIHRNTLIQRLEKIEIITGLNIKQFISSFIIYTLITN